MKFIDPQKSLSQSFATIKSQSGCKLIMKFSQLRALVAVAETGNFSEAASKLQLSQPAVSHAIATLEENWAYLYLPEVVMVLC
jgi:DNA-binding MarR family transcriptional regulator